MTDLPALLTIGYEKRSIDDLLSVLQAREVDCVVDVRLKPWSRRPGSARRGSPRHWPTAASTMYTQPAWATHRTFALYLAGKPEEGHRAFRRHLANGAGDGRAVIDL